jgi:phospholipid transport system transporter-binding protein
MIRDLGDRIEVSGAMNMAAAKLLLSEGLDAASRGALFDLAGVTEVDSSGLAVVFGWQRAATRQGKNIRLANPPQILKSLADVYGVADLLPA